MNIIWKDANLMRILKKQFRNIPRVMITIVCICLSLTLLTSCSLFYEINNGDSIAIGYSKFEKNAFIGPIYCKEGVTTDIIIPDIYEGWTVTELGGYYGRGVPTPFYFYVMDESFDDRFDEKYSTDESYIYDESLELWQDYKIHDTIINVTLPKNLESVTYSEKVIEVGITEREDGTRFADIYRVKCSFMIDESNPYFYTENGKLYEKKSGELVKGLIYA